MLGDARYNSGIVVIVYERKLREATLTFRRSSVDHKKSKCSFKEKRKFNAKKNETYPEETKSCWAMLGNYLVQQVVGQLGRRACTAVGCIVGNCRRKQILHLLVLVLRLDTSPFRK